MAIELVTYVYVEYLPPEEGAPAGNGQRSEPTCKIRKAPQGIPGYFEAHIDDLMERARTGKAPPARFKSAAGRAHFADLLTGDRAAFEVAATKVATTLLSKLDGRSKSGMFVALRRTSPNGAAVLKLDVHDEAAAQMLGDDHELSFVENLLDLPGSLQKGAVWNGRKLIIGDRLAVTSQYFLDAIDASQDTKPADAPVKVVAAVQEVAPRYVMQVHENLTKAEGEITVDEALATVPPAQATRIRAELAAKNEKRPVRKVDPTKKPIKGRISADGITVEGNLSTLDQRVRISATEAGGWLIKIDADSRPTASHDLPHIWVTA